MLWTAFAIAAGLAVALAAAAVVLGLRVRRLARATRALGEAAVTDNLTGLWDYGFWRARLLDRTDDEELVEGLSVVFLDLDGFKQINALHGHLEADAILATVGRRLGDPEPPFRRFCRFGGDEFAGWAAGVGSDDELDELCQELSRTLSRPVALPAGAVSVEASIGRARGSVRDVDAVVAAAEQDLRRRKVSRLEDPDERARLRHRRRDLVRDLLDEQRVGVAYQPFVDLQGDQIVGWEALLRATSPSLGDLPPTLVVESASAGGQLDELTWRIAEQALATTMEAAAVADERLTLSLNLELEQLHAGSSLLERLVSAYDVERMGLVLEISERAIGGWGRRHGEVARELAGRGIELAVDDLGAGQSRSPILLRHHWDYVKLDRTYLLGESAGVATLLRHTADMIRGLDMRPLVEGVETPEQVALLRQAGVRLVQGNLLGKPVPRDRILALMASRERR